MAETVPIPWRNSNPPPNATGVAAVRVTVEVFPVQHFGARAWTAIATDSVSGESVQLTEYAEWHYPKEMAHRAIEDIMATLNVKG